MTDTEQPPDHLDEDALRRRLTNRIALAGVAIVALLGGLAIIDSMYVAPPSKAPQVAISDAVQPVEPIAISPPMAEPAPEPPKPESVPTLPAPRAEPEESAPPTVALPGQPRAKNKRGEAVLEPQALPPMTNVGAVKAYVLQVGVFNNTQNAEELLAKLKKHGIPAQIESRVQVGPFNSAAEAEAARIKLKALGMDSGLLIPLRK